MPAPGRDRAVAAFAVAAGRCAPAGAPAVPLVVARRCRPAAVAMPRRRASTDDFYRYAWDGRVQAAGIRPYRYTPIDPALRGCATTGSSPRVPRREPACTRMNHPTRRPSTRPWPRPSSPRAPGHRPLGPDGGRAPDLAGAAALLAPPAGRAAPRAAPARRPAHAVLWAWCPTVILEAGGSGHVDVLARPLRRGGGRCGGGRPTERSGAALGRLAVATKLLPGLLLPALVAPVHRPAGRPGGVAAMGRTRLPLAAVAFVTSSPSCTCRTCSRSAHGCWATCRST